MKITLESTPELAHANGLPVRVWTGSTERGTPILALITRVATLEGADASEFEGLTEPPTCLVDDVPRLEIGRLRDRLSEFVDEAFGWHPCASFDELLDILEREYHAERIRDVNRITALERALDRLDERLSVAERECPDVEPSARSVAITELRAAVRAAGGRRHAAGDQSESPTLPDVGEAEAFELTSGDRAYYTGCLIYRPPTSYSPRERRIVDAIAAEDEAKARAAEPAGGEP
jgi:hypothetical protein